MDSIEEIKGIGKKTKELFNKLGIYTKNDLIHYYPYRYEILKTIIIKVSTIINFPLFFTCLPLLFLFFILLTIHIFCIFSSLLYCLYN